MESGAATVGKLGNSSKKKLNIELQKDPALPFLISKQTENIFAQKNMYMNVHNSIIYNSENVQLMNG